MAEDDDIAASVARHGWHAIAVDLPGHGMSDPPASQPDVAYYARRVAQALEGLGLEVEAGTIFGLLGPNGAGKSTTVKVLSGILVPDGGTCEVLGRVPWRDRVEHVRRIGVVFGQRTQLWWDLPVAESFDLLRDIYRVPGARHRATLDELVPVARAADPARVEAHFRRIAAGA